MVILILLLRNGSELKAQQAELQSTKYLITEVRYAGLERTKTVTIEREMLIRSGESYNSPELEALRVKCLGQIKNLNLFNHIDIRFENASDSVSSHLVCHVEVIEKWYIWPIPFVEFADRNFNQWWQFDLDPGRTNFGLYLFNYNVRGRNQTVKLSLVTGYTQNLGLSYTVPFTSWNNKVGYYLETHYVTNNEVWYATSDNKLQFLKDPDRVLISRFLNSGSLFYRLSAFNTVYLSGGYSRIQVKDTVVSEQRNPYFLADGNTRQDQYAAALSITREARDNRLFPWKGHYLSLSASSMLINNTKTVLHYLGGKAAIYHPFAEKWAVAGAMSFKVTSLKKAPYYNFKSFGYYDYVRGYENYVVEGQHFGLFKSGLRYALFNEKEKFVKQIPFRQYRNVPVSVILDAFIDAGYVVNNSRVMENSFQNKWLYGTGIGLNMAFYFDKVFRFELTRNHLGQYGVFIHFNKSF